MLRLIAELIPPPLHRLGYRVAHAARKRWWRIARPALRGCRILAFDGEGRVLLVRHSYGSGKWMPPGGGIGRGESPAIAAQRELREEVGCTIDPIRAVAVVDERLHGAANTVHILAGPIVGTPVCDHREIVAARFFAPDALPGDMPSVFRDHLPGWITAAKAAHRPPATDRRAPLRAPTE